MPLSDIIPKAIFPKGRFPEKFGYIMINYDNSAQDFQENVL